MKESPILKKIMVRGSQIGIRLFRNNVGTGWVGRRLSWPEPKKIVIKPQDIVIQNARPLRAGLCVGSSDLIGWKCVVVTPSMVGIKLAVFIGWEHKTENVEVTPEQYAFSTQLTAHGGFGIITRSQDDIDEAMGRFID